MTERELSELMLQMTLDEKVGQLVQLDGSWFSRSGSSDGSASALGVKAEDRIICGSVFGVQDPAEVHRIQDIYLAHSRLKVPLLFAGPVSSGHHVCYPAPIGLGCAWDTDLVRRAYKRIGQEVAANGIMVAHLLEGDTSDGTSVACTETSLGGEDNLLSSRYMAAAVEGIQEGLAEGKGVAACVPLVAGLGQSANASERVVCQNMLASAQSAVKAGCKMVSSTSAVVNGVPAVANSWLLTEVLRDEWRFDGLIASAQTEIAHLIDHVAKDLSDATQQAFGAGLDIDRRSGCYLRNLAPLVRSGAIEERLVDEACWRVLSLKNKLGLFENPYHGCSVEDAFLFDESPERVALVREVAAQTLVLLQNNNDLLPLATGEEAPRVVLAGPYADNNDLVGKAAAQADVTRMPTMREVLEELLGEDGLRYVSGGRLFDEPEDEDMADVEVSPEEEIEAPEEEALADGVDAPEAADDALEVEADAGDEGAEADEPESEKTDAPDEQQDTSPLQNTSETDEASEPDSEQVAEPEPAPKEEVVLLCLGEDQTSEHNDPDKPLVLPDEQMELLRCAHERGAKTVVVLFGSAPFALADVVAYADAVIEAWWPGTAGAQALVDVLFGAVSPTARLTVGLPKDASQLSAPYQDRVALTDQGTLFPFGYGLSYHTAELSDFELSHEVLTPGGPITAEVMLTNTSDVGGTETVQLYLRDVVGSVVRPAKELKGFKKVTLKPRESKRVVFVITEEMLRFWRRDCTYGSEAGEFRAMVGLNSKDVLELPFWLQK